MKFSLFNNIITILLGKKRGKEGGAEGRRKKQSAPRIVPNMKRKQTKIGEVELKKFVSEKNCFLRTEKHLTDDKV